MSKRREKLIITVVGIACVFMFMLGHYAGMDEMHTVIHTRFTEMCPTHEIYHTISGRHVCHLDAVTVIQMD